MRRLLLSIGLVVLLMLGFAKVYELPFAPVLGNFAFGWIDFIDRVANQLTINWNSVLTAFVCLVLIYGGLHSFLRWLVTAMQSPINSGQPACRWSWRWTGSLILAGVLMFVAGLAFIGVIHQFAWIAASKQPHLQEYVNGMEDQSSSERQQEIFLALHYMSQAPPEAHKHSWLTKCLANGSTTVGPVDLTLDWDHPANRPPFSRVMLNCLNPQIRTIRNADNYALSHYAGNVHVFGNSATPKSMADLRKGSSNIILAGEVEAGFKAWGDPSNLRDPSKGFHGGAEEFGGPAAHGALMLMADGSVKFFNDQTSPAVLKTISYPW